MDLLRILYIGDGNSQTTSFQRYAALGRLGHSVRLVSEVEFIPRVNRVVGKLHFLSGYRYLQTTIQKNLLHSIENNLGNSSADLVWVDCGWWCGPRVIQLLKSYSPRVILFNIDDPTGPREPYFWHSLRSAANQFSTVFTVREETKCDFEKLGCPQVARIWRGYDEVAHAPNHVTGSSVDHLSSEVALIATCMEDRPEFAKDLIDMGVPLSIWGNGWQACRNWKTIKKHFRGRALENQAYVTAVENSKLCLGVLSKGNRDQHTQRSSEIPFANGVLCAERTPEHERMFPNGEALLWKDSRECADIVLASLHQPLLLEDLRRRGRQRIIDLGLGNETLLKNCLRIAVSNEASLTNQDLLLSKADIV